MTASFPTTVKSFTAVADGVDYVEAVDVNSLQEEVTALENQYGSAASNVQFFNTSATVSTATTIFSPAGAGRAVKFVVFGVNGANLFMDTVISYTGGAFTVLHATTLTGSPAARTYTWSGADVQLAMASGTYTVRVSAIMFAY